MDFLYNDGGRSAYFKGKRVDDCVVRAISIALGVDYLEVFKALHNIELQLGRSFTDDKVWQQYLREQNWVEHKYGRGAKPLGNLFYGDTFIAVTNTHLSAVKQHTLMDTFDGRDRRCWRTWHHASSYDLEVIKASEEYKKGANYVQ